MSGQEHQLPAGYQLNHTKSFHSQFIVIVNGKYTWEGPWRDEDVTASTPTRQAAIFINVQTRRHGARAARIDVPYTNIESGR
jgi:hypothetical protein